LMNFSLPNDLKSKLILLGTLDNCHVVSYVESYMYRETGVHIE
jgi:hypothetical protein